jgi:two-component system, NarL family, response regulator NreC
MSEPRKLRVLLADDHAVLREGLAVLIDAQPDMVVVAQAANGREALLMAADLMPDVAVLDVSMPEMTGPEATEGITACCRSTRIIALTRHADPAYVRRALQSGASGYVLKKSAANTLINAIRTVARGGTYVEPSLASLMPHNPSGSVNDEPLTRREEDVLRSIAWGRSNKEIANELGLSVKTVESYKATAAGKLHLHSRADIVRYGVARGWLSEDGAPE